MGTARLLEKKKVPEDPWKDSYPPLPRAGSPEDRLVTTLVLQSILLANEEDPLRRAQHCQDAADQILRVALLHVVKGEPARASCLGHHLGNLLDRGIKANLERLPAQDKRAAEYQQVLARAAYLLQELEETISFTSDT